MSKEKILKEFDEKFNRYKLTFDECASLDADYWEAREYLIKAIDQTREETIREVEDMVNKIILKDLTGKWSNDVVDFSTSIVDATVLKIKQSLKSLINK